MPGTPLWWRFLAIGVGILTLFWLPIEDTNLQAPTIIALLFCIIIAIRFLKTPRNTWGVIRHMGSASLLGAAITPFTLLLMTFKAGLHSHDVPDFTAQQITQVIHRTPIWIAASLLIGLGSGIWRYIQTSYPE